MSPSTDLKPVVAAVIPRGDRVLLTERRFHTHGEVWSWPSGKVEDGESYPEALRRELREELLIDSANVGRELGRIDLPTGFRMIHFLVSIPDDVEPINNDGEHLADIRWVTRAEAASAFETLDPSIAAGALRLIDAALAHTAQRRAPAARRQRSAPDQGIGR